MELGNIFDTDFVAKSVVLTKNYKQFNKYRKAMFEAMIIFVMKIGAMGISQR